VFNGSVAEADKVVLALICAIGDSVCVSRLVEVDVVDVGSVREVVVLVVSSDVGVAAVDRVVDVVDVAVVARVTSGVGIGVGNGVGRDVDVVVGRIESGVGIGVVVVVGVGTGANVRGDVVVAAVIGGQPAGRPEHVQISGTLAPLHS
jgi:hypothetical protein